ncbi:MAG: hypothetical protein ACQCN3_02560 [Candidatus Bathyarchaeia archaeon]|jgi:hypothetical protein
MSEGMKASLKEASKPFEMPEPTAILMIRRKGYDWNLSECIKKRIPYKVTAGDGCRMLQMGSVVFVCFA